MDDPLPLSSSPKPTDTYANALDAAARLARIESGYWDIWGHRHETPTATKEAILKSLGYDLRALDDTVKQLTEEENAILLDPVAVVTREENTPLTVRLRLPQPTPAGAKLAVAFYGEDGSSHRADFNCTELGDRLEIPGQPPPGYHDLEAAYRVPGQPEVRASQRLIVTPLRAWMPPELNNGGRLAGLSVSLYGLKSDRNWGAGDFTDLSELLEWVHGRLGAAFVALNPLHAIANRQPFNTSPYLPLSSYFRNYLYLDLERIPEFELSVWAQALVARPSVQAEIAALRESEFVEYERIARLKLILLKLLFRTFLKLGGARLRAFRAWSVAQGDLLDRFAIFCALDEVVHRHNPEVWIWPDWPEEYRDPDSPAIEEFAAQHQKLVTFYKYVQWLVDVQLGKVQERAKHLGMPIGLYHDLALATDRCGADLWAYRNYFVNGCRVGSPPDDFAPEGQDWAFPPPNAKTHYEHGYQLFIETIRRNSRHGGALRIDHVMRFYRLFWIPDGLPAKDGTYVRDHFDDLIGILALESHRGQFIVVGEDLGTVPPDMQAAMERRGMFSYRLFYFEKGSDNLPKPFSAYPKQALVSSTTHDLPTLAGFWAGRDIELRRSVGILKDEGLYWRQIHERKEEKRRMIEALIRDGFLPANFPREAAEWTELTGELHNAIIGFLVSTPSQLMLLNQEDLTKEIEQQNLPGTTAEYPNWRRKMRLTLEELKFGPSAMGFAQMFRHWLERTGRLTSARESHGR